MSKHLATDAEMLSAFARKYWTLESGIRAIGCSASDIQLVVSRDADVSKLPTDFRYKGRTKAVSVFTGSSDLTADNVMRKWIVRGQGGKIVGHQG